MISKNRNGTGRDQMETTGTTRVKRLLAALALSVVAVTSGLLGGAAAMAETDPYSRKPPEVLPERLERKPDVQGATTERDAGSLLPFTGADLTLFLVTGAAAIGTGGLLMKRASGHAR